MSDKKQRVAVAGMLVVEGKALLVCRSQDETFLPGYYELPGGKVDFGEDPHDSLLREFEEEVGLAISVQRPIRVFDYITRNGTDHTIEIVYLVSIKGFNTRISLSNAHDAHLWVSRSDIASLKLSDEVKDSLVAGFTVYD